MRENELNTIISYITNILNINTQNIIKDLLTIYKSTNEEINTIKITNSINDILESTIINTLIKAIDSINVSSNNNQIILDIKINNLPKPYQKEFIFKRGYDSKYTKRYNITYQVNYTSYL